jgi:hypothetical protein
LSGMVHTTNVILRFLETLGEILRDKQVIRTLVEYGRGDAEKDALGG